MFCIHNIKYCITFTSYLKPPLYLNDMETMKTLSASQVKRLNHLSTTGTVIFSDVNENGYLNVHVEKRESKVAQFITFCFGPKGGLHKQEGFKDYDLHTNEPFNKVF